MSGRRGILFEIEGCETAFCSGSTTDAPISYSQSTVLDAVRSIPSAQTMAVQPFDGTYEAGGSAIHLNRLGGILKERSTSPITTLSSAIAATGAVATITVKSTSDFPSSGFVWIGREAFSYTGKTATTFTGCTRAKLGTSEAAWGTTHGTTAPIKRKVYGFNPFIEGRKCWINRWDLDDNSSTIEIYTGYVDSVTFDGSSGFIVSLLTGAKFLQDKELLSTPYAKGKLHGAIFYKDGVSVYSNLGPGSNPRTLSILLDDPNVPFVVNSSVGSFLQINNEIFQYWVSRHPITANADTSGTTGLGRLYIESDDELQQYDYIYFDDSSGITRYGQIVEVDGGTTYKYRFYHTAAVNPANNNTVTVKGRQELDLTTAGRAQADTERGSHTIGDDVKEVRVIEMNHVDAVLSLLMAGSSSPSVPYDGAIPSDWGAALHEDLINYKTFEALHNYATDRRFLFYGPAKAQAILALLSRVTNSRIFWDENGKLTANAERDIYPDSAGTSTITTSKATRIPSWSDRIDSVRNCWIWRGNAPKGSDFKDELVFKEDESVEFYQERSLPEMEDGSLLFASHAARIELVASAVLRRYSDGCPVIEVDIQRSESTIFQPGQIVAVTFPHLPDKQGSDGLSSDLFEVIEFVPHDNTVTARLKLMGMPNPARTRLVAPVWEVDTVPGGGVFTVKATASTHYADATNGASSGVPMGAGLDGKEDIDFILPNHKIVFWDVSTLGNNPPTTASATVSSVVYATKTVTPSAVPAWLAQGDIVRLDDYDTVRASAENSPIDWYLCLADESQDPPDLGATPDDAHVWGL